MDPSLSVKGYDVCPFPSGPEVLKHMFMQYIILADPNILYINLFLSSICALSLIQSTNWLFYIKKQANKNCLLDLNLVKEMNRNNWCNRKLTLAFFLQYVCPLTKWTFLNSNCKHIRSLASSSKPQIASLLVLWTCVIWGPALLCLQTCSPPLSV